MEINCLIDIFVVHTPVKLLGMTDFIYRDIRRQLFNDWLTNKTPAMHRDILRLQLANYRRLIKSLPPPW